MRLAISKQLLKWVGIVFGLLTLGKNDSVCLWIPVVPYRLYRVGDCICMNFSFFPASTRKRFTPYFVLTALAIISLDSQDLEVRNCNCSRMCAKP